ncbi:response regulator [Ferrovibrio terrae]|uniref:response regulator transcription factor n=1 Tax=Ferrovibrio terrae TaxID=2594003 RepID=UPI003137CE52
MDDRLISIIDDDESLRLALVGLVRSLGYRASGFGSAEEFLNSSDIAASSCLITDIQMPGLSGIELKHLLVERNYRLPVIMITGRADPSLRDRALASGAICLLKKPFEAAALLDCIERALAA